MRDAMERVEMRESSLEGLSRGGGGGIDSSGGL